MKTVTFLIALTLAFAGSVHAACTVRTSRLSADDQGKDLFVPHGSCVSVNYELRNLDSSRCEGKFYQLGATVQNIAGDEESPRTSPAENGVTVELEPPDSSPFLKSRSRYHFKVVTCATVESTPGHYRSGANYGFDDDMETGRVMRRVIVP